MARRTVWRDIFRSGCDCVYGKVARPQVQRAHLQTAMLKFLHKFWLSGILPAAAGGILVNITCIETLAAMFGSYADRAFAAGFRFRVRAASAMKRCVRAQSDFNSEWLSRGEARPG